MQKYIDYLLSFSLADGKKYEQKLSRINISLLEEELDSMIENCNYEELETLIINIFIQIESLKIQDSTYTFYKIIEYLIAIKQFWNQDIIKILSLCHKKLSILDDWYFWYIMILFSFWWLDINYLYKNEEISSYIFKELNSLENQSKKFHDLKNNQKRYYILLNNRINSSI